MKVYTKEKEIPYNAQVTVLSKTGLPVQATSFEDTLGLFIEPMEAEYNGLSNLIYIRTDVQCHETSLYEWKGFDIIDAYSYRGGVVREISTLDIVFEDKNGKFGLFPDIYAVYEYVEYLQ